MERMTHMIPDLEMRLERESSTWRLAFSGNISACVDPYLIIDGTRITGMNSQESPLKQTPKQRLQNQLFQGHNKPLSRGIDLSTSIGSGSA
jgi:hypothetical protein